MKVHCKTLKVYSPAAPDDIPTDAYALPENAMAQARQRLGM